MRGINYNYTWFTGCDSRGLPPFAAAIPLASSPSLVDHTPALLKSLNPAGGIVVYFRALRMTLFITNYWINMSVLNRMLRASLAVVLRAMLKILLVTHVCILMLQQHAALADALACFRASIVYFEPLFAKHLNCATKFTHKKLIGSWLIGSWVTCYEFSRSTVLHVQFVFYFTL
jgi:hypothetical protein